MSRLIYSLSLLALLQFTTPALFAEEKPATSRIVAAGLFKNGFAVIKREIAIQGPGVYRLDDVPNPAHGTFWLEGDAAVEIEVQQREIEVAAGADINLQKDLAGKLVTIHFRDGKTPPATGTVASLAKPKPEESPSQPESRFGYAPRPESSPFLVLQSGRGRTFIDASQIASVEAAGQDFKVKRQRPILLLNVTRVGAGVKSLNVSYLTRGLSWAPSYRVDISDPKTLALEQSAVVKNELADLKDVNLQLISGFPNMPFAHVISPLSPLHLDVFFRQLGEQPGSAPIASQMGQMTMNNAAWGNRVDADAALAAIPVGDGVDIHYQPVGPRTLKEGDALSVQIAKEKSDYERIVEWIIPDNRDEHGGIQRHTPQQENEQGAWDALKFKNPFKFPMTTGAALIVANGKFNGQRMSMWTNSGEEAILHINKALSVRTRHIEYEDPGKDNMDAREFIYLGGSRFRKTPVQGEIAVNNHRNETIKLIIRRRFSGNLTSADGEPKSSLREEGVYSVNKRNELTWTLTLKPGEEKKLAYRYSVLVHH